VLWEVKGKVMQPVGFDSVLRRSLIASLLLLTLWFPELSAQSLEEAVSLAESGDYEASLRMFDGLEEHAESAAVRAAHGRVLLQLGRHEEAYTLLRRLARQRHPQSIVAVAYAEVLIARGQLEEATRILGVVIEDERRQDPSAIFVQAEALNRLGRWTQARSNYEDLVTDLDEGRAVTSEWITYAAISLHRLGEIQRANETFALAVALDENDVDARLAWAALFLEEYRPDEAREVALEALEINPNEPRAKVLVGWTERPLNHDPSQATLLAQEALRVNANLPEAYELLASLAIDDEEYGRAIEILSGVLQENPARLESLTLTAAAHYLLDERRSYSRIERRTMRLNSRYALFYSEIGQFAMRAFRYEEAVEFFERAIDTNPDYWPAYGGLGISLTRLGRLDEGIAALQIARDNDPGNVRVFHLMSFFERVAPTYQRFNSDHFSYRVHQDELDVLQAYVPDISEWAYQHYAERYAIELDTPVSIEIFKEPENFAIRSVGLPHVGPHGICFGRVITSRSPSEGDFNWAEVLVHELSHAFTLKLSDSRVPRWLSEGIADYDTSRLRDEWRREADFELLTYLLTDGLISVAHLNQFFVRGQSLEETSVAYYQSVLLVEFLAEKWGETVLLDMLRLFAERRRLEEVLRETTQLGLEEFDAGFEQFVRARLSVLLESFEPNPSLFSNEAFFEARVESAPTSAQAFAELAMAKFHAQKVGECREAVDSALALDPANPLANFLSATFAIREARFEDARGQFEQLLEAGHDGYTLRNQLGYLSRRQGRTNDAIRHYRAAQAFYPSGAEPYQELSDILLRAGRQEEAAAELLALTRVDQNDYSAASTLVSLYAAIDQPEAAFEACDKAIHINPFAPELHASCGRLALSLREWEAAQTEFTLELLLGAEDAEETSRLLDRVRSHLSPPEQEDEHEGSEL